METKAQLLNILVITLMAGYLISTVTSARLLQSNPAADTTSEEYSSEANANQDFHEEYHSVSARNDGTSRHSYENMLTAMNMLVSEQVAHPEVDHPDYETHDNSPGFNGR